MISNILAAFAAIPKILDAINALVAAVERANLMAYMKESATVRKEIAELPEGDLDAYREASKHLHDLIRRLS